MYVQKGRDKADYDIIAFDEHIDYFRISDVNCWETAPSFFVTVSNFLGIFHNVACNVDMIL